VRLAEPWLCSIQSQLGRVEGEGVGEGDGDGGGACAGVEDDEGVGAGVPSERPSPEYPRMTKVSWPAPYCASRPKNRNDNEKARVLKYA